MKAMQPHPSHVRDNVTPTIDMAARSSYGSTSRYEPAAREGHTLLIFGGSLYMWGGWMDNMPKVHDSPEKRKFLSSVDVFQSDSCREWIRQETSGTPPLGVSGYCCAAVGDSLYYFGGWCGHDKCYHNSVHKLSTSSLQWMLLSPSTSESGAPMRKSDSGMVAFRDGEEDILCVVAGCGPTPSYRQPGAQYHFTGMCNEHHMFSLTTREWSSPSVTGQPPLPCSKFTLTSVGERRAALFGGFFTNGVYSANLRIVELTKHTVHWTKINKLISCSVEWPLERCGHAAACVSGSLLVIMGGTSDGWSINSDCWIYDLTTIKWKKLPVPDTVTRRMYHSLSAIQLSPHNMLLVAFGGRRSFSGILSDTGFIELSQKDGLWVGAALEDKAETFSEGRWVEISSDQLREQQLQLERAREVEEQLMAELHQLTIEKEQMTREKEEREQQLMKQVQQLTREKDQLVREKDQAVREKEELQAANTRGREEVLQLRQQRGEEQPHWREEVELTEEVQRKEALGEVRVSNFFSTSMVFLIRRSTRERPAHRPIMSNVMDLL